MRVFCCWEKTLMHNKRAFYDAWECFAVKTQTQTQTQHIFPLATLLSSWLLFLFVFNLSVFQTLLLFIIIIIIIILLLLLLLL